MDTPRMLVAVFDGNGKMLSAHGAETDAEADRKGMEAWGVEQQKWSEDSSPAKPADGPMWDKYARTGRASPNTEPAS